MYLETIADDQATGKVAEIYAGQKARLGFVMAASRCFTTRPDLLPIYNDFIDQVRAGFSLEIRDWRLITLIVAKYVPSTYCSYVYGKQLIEDFGSKEAVIAIHRNFRSAGLTQRDVEMLAYAEKIAIDASIVSDVDIGRLRKVGFTDQNIADIALCAAFRCFIAKYFDAVGAGPEAAFIDADRDFRDAMTVGKAY